jgi:gamma-glutamyltranspeptidase/glutathione hydrolase
LIRPVVVSVLSFALGACAPSPPPSAAPPPAAPSSAAATVSALAAPPVASALTPAEPAAPPPPPLAGGGTRSVGGELGVVTSSEANATRAGIAMLEQGGNAVDAAVAVAFALAVTHPNAGNIGGGGFMLVRAPGGPTEAFDFRESAPAGLTRERFDVMIQRGARGADAVGVPGTVAGLLLAHRRHGALPRERVLAPAIALAREGHEWGAHQAYLLRASFGQLGKDPAAMRVFAKGKQPLPAKARLVQADLAATLERIAALGEAGFYAGRTAADLTAATAGRITAEDLAAYRAVVRTPLTFDYHGFIFETMPPPSAGGLTLAGILRALASLEGDTPATGVTELHRFIEASRRAQAFRRFAVVDPDAIGDAEREARIARFLDPARLFQTPIAAERATPSAAVHPLYAAALREAEHTTHLSVSDREGRVVSLTTTLSASFGAKMLVSGSGFILNNAVASFSSMGDNQPVASRRTTSSMAPTLVLRSGKPVLVLGTPGGDTIPSTLALLVRRLIDARMPLDEATDAPRLHHGFVPDRVRTEPDAEHALPAPLKSELGKLGHKLFVARFPQGDANCIAILDRHAFAYSDPREPGGLAAAAQSVQAGTTP